MYVVSKTKNEVYNFEKVERIYVGSDNIVKIVIGSTRAGYLGEYDSFEKAKAALEILMQRANTGRSSVIFMPDDLEIDAKLHEEKQRVHHISGKKTKGHGGS